jgi:hypothetical protein
MDYDFMVIDCRILNIEDGMLGEDWYCDYDLMELRFLQRNLKCKFIKTDILRLN